MDVVAFLFLLLCSCFMVIRHFLCHLERDHIQAADPVQLMSRVVRKPAFCICENKDADQLRGNREADQRLCFH